MTEAKRCDICGKMASLEVGWYTTIYPVKSGAPEHICAECMKPTLSRIAEK